MVIQGKVLLTRLSKLMRNITHFITLAMNECEVVQSLQKRKSQDKLILFYTVFEITSTLYKIG